MIPNLEIDASTQRRLDSLLDLFEKWNRSINLSGASTRAELVEHLTDSLHVVPHLRGLSKVLDVGSGGGFPVLPAAICLPGTRFVALEPVHKKHAFLRTAARELALRNLDARAERLEDHPDHDYDAATSRATFDLPEWLSRATPFAPFIIGFEAIPRDDLPPSITRVRYPLSNKPRSLILYRPASP